MVGGGGSLLLKLKSLFLHKKEAAKPISSLPDELYLEIFISLPAKSTFICKCVSKTWFSIISSPHFVKLHLNFQINNNSRFIISGFARKIQSTLMYNITKHTLFSTSRFYDEAVEMEHIPTKEYKRIPDCPFVRSVYWPACFFYDSNNDDYKLVYAGNTPNFTVYVYTLRSNSWKTLQPKPSYFDNFNGVLVNGDLHWISETPNIIVSFNISDESFKETELPGEMTEHASDMILTVLEGCLCVVLAESNKAWVMGEYDVWESWTEIQNKIPDDYKSLEWSSENGDYQIYSERTDLFLYGPKHSGARRLDLGSLVIRGVDNYVESLVSLNTGIHFGRKEVIRTRRRGICGKTSISY